MRLVDFILVHNLVFYFSVRPEFYSIMRRILGSDTDSVKYDVPGANDFD